MVARRGGKGVPVPRHPHRRLSLHPQFRTDTLAFRFAKCGRLRARNSLRRDRLLADQDLHDGEPGRSIGGPSGRAGVRHAGRDMSCTTCGQIPGNCAMSPPNRRLLIKPRHWNARLMAHLADTGDPRALGKPAPWDFYPYYGRKVNEDWTVDAPD